jgi:hypothetical protein
MSSEQLYQAFWSHLSQDPSTFRTQVGGRIYHGQAPSSPTYPLAIYNTALPGVRSTFSAGVQSDYVFRVDVYARRTAGTNKAMAISEALEDLLHKSTFSVTDNGTASCTLSSGGQVLIEDDFYRVTHEFLVQCGP